MTRFSLLALALLTLAACRTETTDGSTDASSDPAETAASPAMTDSTSGAVELAAPRRDPDAEATTRQATLKEVFQDGEDCFVMATDAEGELLLMGTDEACAQGAALSGQPVTLTQETAVIEVTGQDDQPVELVVGIAAAQ